MSCFISLTLATVVVVAGIFDLCLFRIPNLLTIPLFFSGIAYHGIAEHWAGLQVAGGGICVALIPMLVLFAMGAVGPGDVKLMAGVGAWLGMDATLLVFVLAALATALYSVVLLVRQGGLRRARVALIHILPWKYPPSNAGPPDSIQNRAEQRRRLVPFGTMVALALIVVLCGNGWLFPGGSLCP